MYYRFVKYAVLVFLCSLIFTIMFIPVAAENQQQISQHNQQLYEEFIEPLLSELQSFAVNETVISHLVNSLPNAKFRPTTYSSIAEEIGSCEVISEYQEHAFYYSLNADKSLRCFTYINGGNIMEIIRQEKLDKHNKAYIHVVADIDENGVSRGFKSYPDERSIECSITVSSSAIFQVDFADVTSIFQINFPFGVQSPIDWYSQSEARAYYRKAWAELYLNPVGWCDFSLYPIF